MSNATLLPMSSKFSLLCIAIVGAVRFTGPCLLRKLECHPEPKRHAMLCKYKDKIKCMVSIYVFKDRVRCLVLKVGVMVADVELVTRLEIVVFGLRVRCLVPHLTPS